MKAIKFIKLDYTGKTTEGIVFDTTEEKVAKDSDIYREGMKYGPVVVALGEGQLVSGLDKALIDAPLGKHTVKLQAEDAFGKKNAKLLRLVPGRVLKKSKIQPYVGQELDLDGNRGIVRVANPGRVIVDFNHPLAGQNVEYDVNIIEEVKDDVVKAEGILTLLNIKHEKVTKLEKSVEVTMPELGPEQFQEFLKNELKRLIGKEITLKKQ